MFIKLFIAAWFEEHWLGKDEMAIGRVLVKTSNAVSRQCYTKQPRKEIDTPSMYSGGSVSKDLLPHNKYVSLKPTNALTHRFPGQEFW